VFGGKRGVSMLCREDAMLHGQRGHRQSEVLTEVAFWGGALYASVSAFREFMLIWSVSRRA